jgi:signal transduction histidine kinase
MIEGTVILILGTTLGVVFESTLESLLLNFISNDIHTVLTFLFGFIGLLIAGLFIFYEREIQERKDAEIRDETVALITHEMRTALTSAGWAIEYMLKQYENKIENDDKEMLEGFVKSNQTTVMHTVNLLDISLSDIGKLTISLEKVPLSKVENMVNEVVDKYILGTKRANIELISSVNLERDKVVEVDIMRLKIIIENLLENSIQYVKGQNDKIELTVNNTKDSLNIVVKDNGIGIPENEQEKVFEEFYRASNARKKLSSGSGIGLHMTYNYVKAHKGKINFTSKENIGTSFNVSIPLKTSADVNEFLKEV